MTYFFLLYVPIHIKFKFPRKLDRGAPLMTPPPQGNSVPCIIHLIGKPHLHFLILFDIGFTKKEEILAKFQVSRSIRLGVAVFQRMFMKIEAK